MTLFYGAAHGLIANNDRYLVTRRSATDDYMPLKWDLPGGTVDPGETMEEGLAREILEETKLAVAVDRVLYVYTNRATLPERQTYQAVYACNYLGGEIELDPADHEQYRWATKSEIADLDAMGFLSAFRETATFIML
jgi:8-oxo-dGTP diphosphatase